MKAHILNGIVYSEIEIISNLTRDNRGTFHPRELAPQNVNTNYGYDDFEDGPVAQPYPYAPLQTVVYGRGSMLSKMTTLISHEPRTYRFLGDLFTYKIHWIDSSEPHAFICKHFATELNYTKKKINQGSSEKFVPYVCSTKIIKRTFTPKDQALKPVTSHDEAWGKVPDPSWKKSLANRVKRTDFYSKDRERAFCLGCSMEKKTNEKILMTAIDISNNTLAHLSIDLDCAHEIKNAYLNDNKNGRYDKVEKWLYNNDLTISCEKGDSSNGYSKKEYKIVSKPTIYSNLSGEIYIPDHRSILIGTMHQQAHDFNGYVGDCYTDEIVKRSTANKCVIDGVNKIAIFLDGTTGEEYHKYELPDSDFDDIGVADMLEL